MRRLLRWILTGFTALSLILWLATVVLWVRSYWRGEDLMAIRDVHIFPAAQVGENLFTVGSCTYRCYIFRSTGGFFGFGCTCGGGSDDGPYPLVPWRTFEPDRRLSGSLFTFRRLPPNLAHPGFPPLGSVRMSYLFPTIAFLILPVVCSLRGIRQARRAKVGGCSSCGYDLRATPGRCPECGKICASSAVHIE